MTEAPIYPSDEWQRAYMKTLGEQIWAWKRSYYNEDGGRGPAAVDDATYDLWWRNLLFLESKYPHLIDLNTPTEAVGAPLESTPVKMTLAEMAPTPRRLTLSELQGALR